VLSALLFLALAGLFSMHGLDTHGALALATPTSSSTSTVHDPHDPKAATITSVVPDAAEGAAAESVHGPQSHHDEPMSMAGLCLTVLGTAILALTLWMTPSLRHGFLLPSPRLVRLRASTGRDPGPPSLSVLCVCRC